MSALAVVTKPADQRTDDVDLVAAVRAGDDRAFELLFVRYQAGSRPTSAAWSATTSAPRTSRKRCSSPRCAGCARPRRPIAFKPWIYEIAKNACIDAFRRARNTSEVPFDDDDALGPSIVVASGGGPDAVVDAKLAIDNLCGAFGGLSQTHHDILVMREFEDLSYREIGERLGMSRAAVESTLFRARRRLSEEYEELVSGERCLRVRAIVDAPPGRAPGVRDQRRMARHIAHCQPCRRYARLAGVDLDVVRAPAAARIAALIPLPAFVRRRFDLDDGSRCSATTARRRRSGRRSSPCSTRRRSPAGRGRSPPRRRSRSRASARARRSASARAPTRLATRRGRRSRRRSRAAGGARARRAPSGPPRSVRTGGARRATPTRHASPAAMRRRAAARRRASRRRPSREPAPGGASGSEPAGARRTRRAGSGTGHDVCRGAAAPPSIRRVGRPRPGVRLPGERPQRRAGRRRRHGRGRRRRDRAGYAGRRARAPSGDAIGQAARRAAGTDGRRRDRGHRAGRRPARSRRSLGEVLGGAGLGQR